MDGSCEASRFARDRRQAVAGRLWWAGAAGARGAALAGRAGDRTVGRACAAARGGSAAHCRGRRRSVTAAGRASLRWNGCHPAQPAEEDHGARAAVRAQPCEKSAKAQADPVFGRRRRSGKGNGVRAGHGPVAGASLDQQWLPAGGAGDAGGAMAHPAHVGTACGLVEEPPEGYLLMRDAMPLLGARARPNCNGSSRAG